MPHKRLLFQSAAREKVLRGATTLADAVRVTLGPKSKSVLIQKKWGEPIVCNDGVTIAKETSLEDPEEDLGAQMLRQAAVRTGDTVGDGTSTSTILAHAIFSDGVRNVVAGASGIDIKRGLDRGLQVAVDELRKMSTPVKTREDKLHVATISAHNDATIGELVADAMDRIGDDGIISVEESKTTETILEVVEGMQLDRGYISPYFVTNTAKMEAVLDDAYVLLFDGKITTLNELMPLLDNLVKIGRPITFIAEDISGDAFYELKKDRAGCFNCMTRCGGMREVTGGPFSGSQIDGPEYETIFAFGPLLGLTDPQFAVDANALCDAYGIDTVRID